jgi:hypothetical protein
VRYEGWREISGVRSPTHRVNFHSGIKRGEATTEDIRVNGGLRMQHLAVKPADFTPDIPVDNGSIVVAVRAPNGAAKNAEVQLMRRHRRHSDIARHFDAGT